VKDIIGYSRKHFAGEKEKVETEIKKWTNRDFNLEMQKAQNQNQGSNNNRKKEEKKEERKEERVEVKREEKREVIREQPKAKEAEVVKEIERIVKEVEKQEKKEAQLRKKVLKNLQGIHALKANAKPKIASPVKSDLDEVPEDVLKALLNMGDL
jgi:long-chain acyl-CoA synthetase